MVVKEKRGRKRYILFNHSKDFLKNDAYNLFHELFKNLESKIKWKIVKFNDYEGILLVDNKIALKVRNIIKQNTSQRVIETKKTSGTLKSLMK